MSDLIVREDAIKALRHVFGTCDPCCREEAVDIAVTTVEAIPSARPKEGRWIEVTNGRGGHECSECHDYAPSFQSGAEHLSHFCPNCGADMRPKGDTDV